MAYPVTARLRSTFRRYALPIASHRATFTTRKLTRNAPICCRMPRLPVRELVEC